ncbi:MAG: hypothetical protein ONB23_08265 [candidate division KSB1 bacterium]|nr:hypothetical protein [candidate division KSB1 bacterium]
MSSRVGSSVQEATRPAEILVLGLQAEPVRRFVEVLCGHITFAKDRFLLGTSLLEDRFRLLVYGVQVPDPVDQLALDLVAERMVGTILLYPWDDPDAHERVEALADWYEQRFQAPLVVAAFGVSGDPLPGTLQREGLHLSPTGRLVGLDLSSPRSVVGAVLVLLAVAAERVADLAGFE